MPQLQNLLNEHRLAPALFVISRVRHDLLGRIDLVVDEALDDSAVGFEFGGGGLEEGEPAQDGPPDHFDKAFVKGANDTLGGVVVLDGNAVKGGTEEVVEAEGGHL